MSAVKAILVLLTLAFTLVTNAADTECKKWLLGGDPSLQFVDGLLERALDPEYNERLGIEVIRQVNLRRQESQDTVLGWMDSIKQNQRTQPLTVLEHAALLYILQSDIFDDPDVILNLKEGIDISYRHLSGDSNASETWNKRLPVNTLSAATLRGRLFYEAVLQEQEAEPKPSLRSRIGRHLNITNTMTVLLGVATLSFDLGREVFAGALVGLTQAAFTEFLIHIGVGHADRDVANQFHKFGRVGRFLGEVNLAHKLHHTVVSQDFGAAVLTDEQKARADVTLQKLAESLVASRIAYKHPEWSKDDIQSSPEFATEVDRIVGNTRRGNYGINGTFKGALGMLAAATPYYLLNWALYAATGSEAFFFSANATMTFMILQSLYSHWYLHYRPEDDPNANTTRLQMWYLTKFPIGKLAQRLHFVHHHLPFSYGRTKNGNIMAGSVTDRLRRDVHNPRVSDLLKFYQQGFLFEPEP